MASAFISYAHEDQEFVLALAQHLRRQAMTIRYDQVALHIGDSLIRAVSREIAEGDFLIAVVSPDSVESEWCQTELALARSQGIDERRVKVLPVRWRGAAMPQMLQDTYWGDADRDDVETLARRLAAAMKANLEGQGDRAARAAEEAPDAQGLPAHAEIPGDVAVAHIEAVAQRVWDVFSAWTGVWRGGNIRDLTDPQRRLRWALDALPELVRSALPLTERFGSSAWDEFFDDREPEDVERDIRDELRSVRTQVAQGLPVGPRWIIDANLGPVSADNRDAFAFLWQIRKDERTERIQVFVSRPAMMSSNEHLPREVAEAKETDGRSVVITLLGIDDPPRQVSVTTAGISIGMP